MYELKKDFTTTIKITGSLKNLKLVELSINELMSKEGITIEGSMNLDANTNTITIVKQDRYFVDNIDIVASWCHISQTYSCNFNCETTMEWVTDYDNPYGYFDEFGHTDRNFLYTFQGNDNALNTLVSIILDDADDNKLLIDTERYPGFLDITQYKTNKAPEFADNWFACASKLGLEFARKELK